MLQVVSVCCKWTDWSQQVQFCSSTKNHRIAVQSTQLKRKIANSASFLVSACSQPQSCSYTLSLVKMSLSDGLSRLRAFLDLLRGVAGSKVQLRQRSIRIARRCRNKRMDSTTVECKQLRYRQLLQQYLQLSRTSWLTLSYLEQEISLLRLPLEHPL